MSGLSVDVRVARPGFGLAVRHDFPAHGLTAIFGRSGAGKSTLLRAIAGLEPAAGRVSFGAETWQGEGRPLPPHRRRIGFVFQDARLFAHLSVAGNLAYARRRAAEAVDPEPVLAALGLEPLMARRPATLSGGERQRVAIGRALMSAPRLLMLDEPLAALDAAARTEILGLIERVRDIAGVPILYVTHAVAELAALAGEVVLMAGGRVTGGGPVGDLLGDPQAAALLGPGELGGLLPARVVAHHADGLAELQAAAGRLWVGGIRAEPGAEVRLRIWAKDVILALGEPQGLSALNHLPATVRGLGPAEGAGISVGLDCGGVPLVARVTRRSAGVMMLRPGLRCWAVLKSVAVGPVD